ncbi:MAG: Gfo/Idh/MocA family oxidoreductase [Bacteroidota bacterium]
MEKTKVGVVGLGGMAQLVHLPILSKFENVELKAVCEINRSRLKTVAEKFTSANQYVDYKEMLDKEELDAVIIATPTNTHLNLAIDCLQAKKDILIEKPISLNYSEAKEIVSAAKKNKKQVMVGMNLRFRPDAMLLRSLISSGELGELFYIKCGWLREQSSNQKWFLSKKLSGGGVLFDLGIVILDLALWMMGDEELESVAVQNFYQSNKEVEDSVVGIIRFKKGMVLNFEVSWDLYSEANSFNLTAHGTNGTAYLNPLRLFKKIGTSHIDYTPNKSIGTQNLFRKSYENELKHFIGSIREGVKVISSGEEALARMYLLENIYKSAEQQKEVRVKNI